MQELPGGVPVGTLAIGKPGAINAALLAAILARADKALAAPCGLPRAADGRRGADAARRRLMLAPGATIGILGGGQLARMLALAGARLGLKAHVFSPVPDDPPSTFARRARKPN